MLERLKLSRMSIDEYKQRLAHKEDTHDKRLVLLLLRKDENSLTHYYLQTVPAVLKLRTDWYIVFSDPIVQCATHTHFTESVRTSTLIR